MRKTMCFNVCAGTMFVGTLVVTPNGHHRFRDRSGDVGYTENIVNYKRLRLVRY